MDVDLEYPTWILNISRDPGPRQPAGMEFAILVENSFEVPYEVGEAVGVQHTRFGRVLAGRITLVKPEGILIGFQDGQIWQYEIGNRSSHPWCGQPFSQFFQDLGWVEVAKRNRSGKPIFKRRAD